MPSEQRQQQQQQEWISNYNIFTLAFQMKNETQKTTTTDQWNKITWKKDMCINRLLVKNDCTNVHREWFVW